MRSPGGGRKPLTAHGFWPLLRSWWIRSLAATRPVHCAGHAAAPRAWRRSLGRRATGVSERTVNRMLHDAGYSLQANRENA